MGKIHDLTGQKFGRLTVLFYEYTKRQAYWRCRCDCGNEKTVVGYSLVSGTTQSCGCLFRETLVENGKSKKIDLTNQRFGRLLVIKDSLMRAKTCVIWECLCDCGNITNVDGMSLRYGDTRSCGCFAKEKASARLKTHGMTGTREFIAWTAMRRRCLDPKNASYEHYGKRGITVCYRWLNSFENFYNDMGAIPLNYASLDRIDNDKGYSPENCRWATNKQQCRNKSDNLVVRYNGIEKVRVEWLELMGIDKNKWNNTKRYKKLSDEETLKFLMDRTFGMQPVQIEMFG